MLTDAMLAAGDREAVAKNYVPAPLDLSDVELPSSLRELTEAIAENTHECWSKGRLDEGWTYGPERNDVLRKHPDLLPYSDLSEGEKEYDRVTAINAIKLIVKLGYNRKTISHGQSMQMVDLSYAAYLEDARKKAEQITLWEKITRTNHEDVTFYKGLLKQYTE